MLVDRPPRAVSGGIHHRDRPTGPSSSRERAAGRRVGPPPSATEAAISKEEKIEVEGEVVEALRNGMFRVAMDNGHEAIGYTARKMRRFRIRILPGDRIKLELSPYDLTRGRITYRFR